MTHTNKHTHSCSTGVCAHSPRPEGVSPCSHTCDPTVPRGEECDDEGLEDSSGVRVVSSYKHLA